MADESQISNKKFVIGRYRDIGDKTVVRLLL